FVPDKLDGKPREQIDQMLKTPSTLTKSTLSPLNKERTDHLLQRCAEFYLSRGIVVKACYEDFDRHNMGYVTFSQFHRSFPGPVEVTDTEISMLARRYYDPLVKLYNYYRFNDDIRSIWEREGGRGSAVKQQSLLSPVKEASSIQDIINQIRDTVYKYGIRTTEFFTDFDKLRSGLVTENQFLQIKFSNEKESLLKEKTRADRLEEQIELMKEANNIQTRSRRSYSYSSSHHYDSFPSNSDSFSPPPFAHQSVSDSSYFPFNPTPSPSPHISERRNKPRIVKEDVISRNHDYTTSIPSHIRPHLSREEMYRRFGGGQMRREEYERPRVSPAYTSSIPKSVQPQLSEEEMKSRFKPRVSPAYTTSIPDSVRPQVSEEEMKRRFKNRQQPYNQYRREDSEEYWRVNEETDQALLEVDRIRKQNPIHP
ncbi:PREDICTED: uncharacterized protein LOC109589982, partial [Amphimedon queenslandica]|uniref:EF-hand domain-containing protein n=1 Tax=Amphimedon queenslandica TaxID=400682 RepID=A0AAN0JWQ4_AMPQE